MLSFLAYPKHLYGRTARLATMSMNKALVALQVLAFCGSPAFADPSGMPPLHEREDGTLVLSAPVSVTFSETRYTHHAALVAGDCVRLDGSASPRGTQPQRLINQCRYPIVVSYCLDSADAAAEIRCDTVGRRRFGMERIEPDRSYQLAEQMQTGEVKWVACRGDAGVVSGLTLDGTRGECLAPERAASAIGSR